MNTEAERPSGLNTIPDAMNVAELDVHEMIRQQMDATGWSPELDERLALCPDAECGKCAAIICPHGESLHFHHDGCPSCDT